MMPILFCYRGEQIPGGQKLLHDSPIQLQQEIAFEDAQETLGKVGIDCKWFWDSYAHCILDVATGHKVQNDPIAASVV